MSKAEREIRRHERAVERIMSRGVKDRRVEDALMRHQAAIDRLLEGRP